MPEEKMTSFHVEAATDPEKRLDTGSSTSSAQAIERYATSSTSLVHPDNDKSVEEQIHIVRQRRMVVSSRI
jgi:hypothetical protein